MPTCYKMKERKITKYKFVPRSTICGQCKKKFKYESKTYKNSGIPVNIRTVCRKCQKLSAARKAREARQKKGERGE